MRTAGNKLAFEFENLEIHPNRIHNSASGMLSTIIKLFDSLSNRTFEFGRLPSGSIEGMFFSELANWIVIELPLLKFDSEESLIVLKARRKYFDEVLDHVLVPDNRKERNNPMTALNVIMVSLDSIIEATEDLIQLTTFHEHGARLDNAILGMAAQAFQVLRLTIKGDHVNERDLPVYQLLDDTQTSRPKINELKQKRLAFWLKTTLMQVDIRGFDFVAHQSISLEEAANHLYGEDIDDTPCTLPPKLRKNPNHSDWGHWEFTFTNLNGSPRDIKSATKNIKQIYRDILKLYYARELLAKLRKVSPIYGEVWLYKDTTGKAMLSMLLNIANEMTETLNESLGFFFNTTFGLFKAKARQAEIKKNDECYSAMKATKDKYSRFTHYSIKATEQIKTIRQRIGTFDPRLAKADETKYQLLKALVEFIESGFGKSGTVLESSAEYEILKKALSSAPAGATSLSVSSIAASSRAPSGATSSNAPAEAASSSILSGATSSSNPAGSASLSAQSGSASLSAQSDSAPLSAQSDSASSNAQSGAASSSAQSGSAPPSRATPCITQHKTLRELRIRVTQESGVTKLDLSTCGLNALSRKDRNILSRQLDSLPNHRIIEADLKDNALYNITKDTEEDKEIATATLIQIVLKLPASVTTLYLAGNGIQYYNHAELSKLFSRFPKHILTVSLRGEKPLELSQQLARLDWPKSYYDLTHGKHNFMAIAETLLVDYSKSCGFKVFLSLHWNRHLTAQIRDIWEKMETEFDTEEKLFKKLNDIDKDNNRHGGSFSRRYTFLYHCYSGRTPSLESSRNHSPATQVADAEDTHSTIELSAM